MTDLIIKLRQQLVSMIEEIDNYNILLDDTIFIKKEDLKWIKYLGKSNSYIHEFEFKNKVKFSLRVSSSYPLDLDCYNKLMNGTLELIILNKFPNEVADSEALTVFYKLEDPIKTKLRNLYNPIALEKAEESDTQKE